MINITRFIRGLKNRVNSVYKLEEINLPTITRYSEQSTENIRFQKTDIPSLSPSLFKRFNADIHWRTVYRYRR